ncbi:hypothetical protein JOC70_002888 [Clostridium pascui]|uniref:DUF1659 domain-containing protein n=1 Tax=Clostridium pascui TaxID=46609 RepID=UPI00195DAE47|nr:DUF1659 domain-containing protein [Clostridium pascui]MBM7871388.1 hypothetical protein [Clostridium pascui]
MAITADMVKKSLILEYVVGTDDEGKDVIGSQRFPKIKTAATDDALNAVAQAISPVLKNPVLYTKKQEDSVLG